jgi:nucleoid DNA-binding protein
MKKMNIQELQKEYIRTKDQEVLAELYVQLMNLGKFSIKKNKCGDLEDLEDIVSNFIMKLITEENPKLIEHPSGYLKQALYYSQKPKKKYVKLLTDEEYQNPEGLIYKPINTGSYSIEDEVLDRVETERTFQCIYQIIDEYIIEKELTEEEARELVNYIIDCLELGRHYKRYLYKINTKQLKEYFTECFERIRVELKKEHINE